MIRQIRSLEDARTAIVDLFKFKDRIESRDVNMHGRRIVNAGPSQTTSDYVIRQELGSEIQLLTKRLDMIIKIQDDIREQIYRLSARITVLEEA